jgi:hypothetical protein
MRKVFSSPWFPPLILGALAVVTRLPWLGRVLYDFDSIAFAFSLEEFDVSRHSPHPPGYLFYVAAGKLLNRLLQDPNRAFVWVSVLAGAGTVALLYRWGERFFSPRTGWIAAGLLLGSPLFWTYSEVCAPYIFSALFSVLVAGLVLRGIRGDGRGLVWAAAAAGLGSGFRPEVLITMSPLWLFFSLRSGWKRLLAAGAACAAGFALWFVPTVWMSRGLGPYLDAVRLQSAAVWNQGIPVNAAKVLVYSAWALGAGCLLLPWLPRAFSRLSGEGRLFFLLWMLPYPLLAVFVAFGQPGMLLVFIPPLVLLVSEGVSAGFVGSRAGAKTEPGRALGVVLTAIVLLGNVWIFSCAPFLSARGYLEDGSTFLDKVRTEFFLLSGKGIRFSDRYVSEILSSVRGHFDPSDTLILTNFKGWVLARYYLRPFPVHNYFCFYGLKDGQSHYVPEGVFEIPGNVKRIVLFNGDKHSIHFQDTLGPFDRNGEITRTLRTPGGFELRFLPVDGQRKLLLQPEGFFLQ